MVPTKIRALIATLALAAITFAATASRAADTKVPATPEEHQAMAAQYRDQAAQYKKLADDHRAMAAAYAQQHVPTNGPTPNTEAVKMKKHCEAIAKDADKLAHDAEMAATYHEQRAKELQSK
jgi:hypothetical protein